MQNLMNLSTIVPSESHNMQLSKLNATLLLSTGGMGTVPPIEIRIEATDDYKIIKI